MLALLRERGEGAVAAGEDGVTVKRHEFGAVILKLVLKVGGAAAHRTREDGIADDGERPAEAADDEGSHAGGVAKGVEGLDG